MSFFVKENNQYVAVCPLILEDHGGIMKFSFSGFGIPAPALANGLLYKARKKTQDFIFEYIDSEAHLLNVQKALFRFSPLAPGFMEKEYPPSNYIMKYGYIDASFNTQILDITHSIEDIKYCVRKGHKFDINRASRVIDINIFDENTITREVYDLYCELHHKDAGRVTRPKITFDLMFDWIKTGKAALSGAKLKGENKFVGFAYFISYKKGIYYASACSDPAMQEIPIAHYILWESIKWFKNKGIKYFELGWQFYDSTFHYGASEKECSISKFKRGFGGEQIAQIVAEKYYDMETFQKEYTDRIENYRKYISKNKG